MSREVSIHDAQPGWPWPVRPRPIDGEATFSYMVRAACANGYESLRQLHTGVKSVDALYEGVRLSAPERQRLFGPHPSYWGGNDFALGLLPADFNHHFMRWCPICLRDSAHLRGQWMLKLCCVCSQHAIHLHDQCPVCGLVQRLERTDFERCACGARLAVAPVRRAAPSLVRVTRAIEASIFCKPETSTWPVLSAPDWLRLAGYLGQFSEAFQPARPGKIANLHHLEQATTLMTGVSQLLDDWPTHFHAVMAAIQNKAEASPSIRRAFGALYRVLYDDLRGDGFQFLRDEFERYLREHWWGVVCKRNRSFKSQTVADHPRVTLKHAAQQAGVAPATVRRLLQAELIPSDQFVFPSGRKVRSLHQDDLAQLATLANNCVTLSEAARQLVLPERRVRELIAGGIILPLVSRTHDKAAAWLIPKQVIQSLCFAGCAIFDASSSIAVGRLLRFWRLLDGEFIALVQAIVNRQLVTVATQSGMMPLGNVALDVSNVRNWLSSYRLASGPSMTIDQASQHLGLKQQVAYDLVRRGLLVTVKNQSSGSRVQREAIETFRSAYISLAEFSRHLQHSPRWVLQNTCATPVTGPSVDGCRQYFFRRSEAIPLMGNAVKQEKCHKD
ncbi:MAG: MerR family transcriptional regulator [Hydrogenophilales bacterium 28-61-11]|nr:MAG: MerR family transcriptional regulator [Hydrogenophilales bacterium 28-61-11]OYZ58547.1 MAG: MerR family transcriptional regulator [Hydrogenophilales bacterium 16-61-112]OZA50428.1 MAG: MerR family transcriptional regulator [Hydrogenophilales bacterium 17-61-76]